MQAWFPGGQPSHYGWRLANLWPVLDLPSILALADSASLVLPDWGTDHRGGFRGVEELDGLLDGTTRGANRYDRAGPRRAHRKRVELPHHSTAAFLPAGMPTNEHVLEIPLTTSSSHMALEDPQGNDGAPYPQPGDVHFATIEEKKRLWFRDAIINALFIASWCVWIYDSSASSPTLSHHIGSS